MKTQQVYIKFCNIYFFNLIYFNLAINNSNFKAKRRNDPRRRALESSILTFQQFSKTLTVTSTTPLTTSKTNILRKQQKPQTRQSIFALASIPYIHISHVYYHIFQIFPVHFSETKTTLGKSRQWKRLKKRRFRAAFSFIPEVFALCSLCPLNPLRAIVKSAFTCLYVFFFYIFI